MPTPNEPAVIDRVAERFRTDPEALEEFRRAYNWPSLNGYCAALLQNLGAYPERTRRWATPREMARITVVIYFWDEHDTAMQAAALVILENLRSERDGMEDLLQDAWNTVFRSGPTLDL